MVLKACWKQQVLWWRMKSWRWGKSWRFGVLIFGQFMVVPPFNKRGVTNIDVGDVDKMMLIWLRSSSFTKMDGRCYQDIKEDWYAAYVKFSMPWHQAIVVSTGRTWNGSEKECISQRFLGGDWLTISGVNTEVPSDTPAEKLKVDWGRYNVWVFPKIRGTPKSSIKT